ncbi:MAG: ABC transporter permease, partial [Blastocatellia bacterium]
MSIARRIWSLSRNLLFNARIEKDLDEEVRGYLALSASERVGAGAGESHALRDTVTDFGGADQIKEQIRDSRRGHMIETLIKDAKYGLRTLAKSPGLAAIAILSLALGIGGNTAMFSIVNSALIRPLTYPQPDSLVRITQYYPRGGVVALQARSKSMDISAYATDFEFNLIGEGAPAHLAGSAVFANLFSLLGVDAQVGRTFRAGENQPGQDGVVVLSYGLWRERFAGDPGAIGRPINLDGTMRTIVGVMPPSFSFPSPTVRLWVPVRLDPSDQIGYWDAGWVPLVARLRAGATLPQAREEVRTLNLEMLKLFPYSMPPDWNKNATVLPLQQDMVSDIRAKLLLLLAAVGLVLMIACANVASLLLAKATARQKELAIRAALGAGRGRIFRQLLTEAVMLSVAGAAAGLGLASGLLQGAKALLPIETPGLAQIGIDWRALAFASVLAVVTGLVFGLVPALTASKINLAESIKTRGQRASGTGATRLRGMLIVAEVALAAVLVVGATLLSRSLWLLTQANPGFKADNVLTARIYPDQVTYQPTAQADLKDSSPSRSVALY